LVELFDCLYDKGSVTFVMMYITKCPQDILQGADLNKSKIRMFIFRSSIELRIDNCRLKSPQFCLSGVNI